jgi:hypothetical protein
MHNRLVPENPGHSTEGGVEQMDEKQTPDMDIPKEDESSKQGEGGMDQPGQGGMDQPGEGGGTDTGTGAGTETGGSGWSGSGGSQGSDEWQKDKPEGDTGSGEPTV